MSLDQARRIVARAMNPAGDLLRSPPRFFEMVSPLIIGVLVTLSIVVDYTPVALVCALGAAGLTIYSVVQSVTSIVATAKTTRAYQTLRTLAAPGAYTPETRVALAAACAYEKYPMYWNWTESLFAHYDPVVQTVSRHLSVAPPHDPALDDPAQLMATLLTLESHREDAALFLGPLSHAAASFDYVYIARSAPLTYATLVARIIDALHDVPDAMPLAAEFLPRQISVVMDTGATPYDRLIRIGLDPSDLYVLSPELLAATDQVIHSVRVLVGPRP